MSAYASPFCNRVYQRKFDYDEAKRRRSAGESLTSIAAAFGVSPAAVARATNGRTRAMMDENSRRWLAEHPPRDLCECGREKDRRSARCRACWRASLSPVEVVNAAGHVWCTSCNAYRPADAFSYKAANAHRAFRCHLCRHCETRARQDYRERHKVPCAYCGAPALPVNEKGRHGGTVPRCRPCYYQHRRSERRAA